MKIEKRNWTITLGGANRGKDIDRELTVREFKSNFEQMMDAFVQGDNQSLKLPITVDGKHIDTHYLAVEDADPTPGRILADLADGTIQKNEKANPYTNYENRSKRKAIFEFDPESGKPQRYSTTSDRMAFDVSFQDGQLQEIASEKYDGTYRESVTFSNDGKTVSFQSEEKVEGEDGPKVKGEWFLSMG
ncbi:MAG: hypothetical protein KC800_05940 [Candidatus Eremiobacteraeota bacterium]|nr:hypothetical protein [Candidatus Eremiobacteraeota bacterium]